MSVRVFLLCLAVFSLCLAAATLALRKPAQPSPSPKPAEVKNSAPEQARAAAPAAAKISAKKIDLDAAVEVALPSIKKDLVAEAFHTPDGKTGWVLRIPGGRPIATPAYADGLLFVGGGYGSHEFYAFDADSGKVVWKIATGDDGPTAAVVADGFVAFNTESCTLVVVDEKTGKVIWQEWLGDPLMSQPAIDKGRLFIAFPGGQSRGARDKVAAFHPKPATPGGSHRMLAADLRTGKHLWEQVIAADVITAPVVSDAVVYFTTYDGTSYALAAGDGSVVWVKKNAGTSAPVVFGGQVLQTRKEMRGKDSYEGLTRMDAKKGTEQDKELLARERAAYLDAGKGGGVAVSAEAQKSLDSSVGFGSAPPAAKLSAANENVGVNTVAGAWAYQGSKAAVSRGQVLNAQGRYLNSLRMADGRESWRREITGKHLAADAQAFSPPALGREYMYLAGGAGHLISVRQSDGAIGFAYSMKAPVLFQPALARGNVYAGTSDGRLICLKTGTGDADGWYAWGGNAQHNKVQ